MTIAEFFLSQFEPEMKTTRSILERVPDDKLAWKPHSKSASLAELAGHIASVPGYGVQMMGLPKSSEDGSKAPHAPASREEILQVFDNGVNECRSAVIGSSDEEIMRPWSLEVGGRALFTLPRAFALHTVLLRHLVHHRGQLSVYLRLNDVPVPSIYGPTADEPLV